MAIHVALEKVDIRGDALWLAVQTTNDAVPDHAERFYVTAKADEAPAEIKAKIDALVSLYWLARALGDWQV